MTTESRLKFDDQDDVTWSKTATNEIPYAIIWSSREDIVGQFHKEQFSLMLKIKVKYSDYWKWLRDMLGYSEVDGDALTRVLPEQCPMPIQDGSDTTRKLPIYCLHVQLLGVEDNGYAENPDDEEYDPSYVSPQPNPDWNQWPMPGWAYAQCTFAAVPWQVLSDGDVTTAGVRDESQRFTFARTRYAAENEKVPGGSFFTVEVPRVYIPETFFRRGAMSQIDWFLYDVPEIPRANLEACCGAVNNDDIVIDGQTYSAEKVLFDSYDREPVFDAWGRRRWQYCFKMLAREDDRTWNKYRKPNGTVVNITNDGTVGGAPPFKLIDLPGNMFKWS